MFAVKVEHDAAHGVGGTAAIVHQLAEILVTLLPHILPECGKQVVKRLQRQAERLQCFGLQTLHQRGLQGFATADSVQFGAQAVQTLQAFFIGCAAFVGNIVGGAGKGINGMGGLAQTARQHDGADGEVFVVVNRHIGSSGKFKLQRERPSESG